MEESEDKEKKEELEEAIDEADEYQPDYKPKAEYKAPEPIQFEVKDTIPSEYDPAEELDKVNSPQKDTLMPKIKEKQQESTKKSYEELQKKKEQ